MKIRVRTNERRFTIYIPNFLLTSGVKIVNFVSKSLVENNVSKDGMDKIYECLGYGFHFSCNERAKEIQGIRNS